MHIPTRRVSKRARSGAHRYARDQRQVKRVGRLSPPPILDVSGGEWLASRAMAGVALSEEGATFALAGTSSGFTEGRS